MYPARRRLSNCKTIGSTLNSNHTIQSCVTYLLLEKIKETSILCTACVASKAVTVHQHSQCVVVTHSLVWLGLTRFAGLHNSLIYNQV